MKCNTFFRKIFLLNVVALVALFLPMLLQAGEPVLGKAFIDGTGPGWKTLGQDDFININCDPETWTSVSRSRKDDWCGTGDLKFRVKYDGDFHISNTSLNMIY